MDNTIVVRSENADISQNTANIAFCSRFSPFIKGIVRYTRQLKMLKERFHSYVVLILTSDEDRYFLDKVTNKTIELEHNTTMMYKGNYTEFKKKKQAYEDSLKNKYENDLKEIKRIRKGKVQILLLANRMKANSASAKDIQDFLF